MVLRFRSFCTDAFVVRCRTACIRRRKRTQSIKRGRGKGRGCDGRCSKSGAESIRLVKDWGAWHRGARCTGGSDGVPRVGPCWDTPSFVMFGFCQGAVDRLAGGCPGSVSKVRPHHLGHLGSHVGLSNVLLAGAAPCTIQGALDGIGPDHRACILRDRFQRLQVTCSEPQRLTHVLPCHS